MWTGLQPKGIQMLNHCKMMTVVTTEDTSQSMESTQCQMSEAKEIDQILINY